ncbi:hypothetical protein [Streptomyces platensis]|uniref:hypothetical protein n=1 Tax=Streptomyces platensis TaxID=58346 RepID=UPI001F22B345|nr:hypothetical protein [Streptomyces platensis]MCF3147031.1 hypothetical protein [Streptomyces platensis]
MQRAQKLRMTGLAGVVGFAIAVPLGAAMAGPADLAAFGTAATSEKRPTAKRGIRLDSGAKSDMRPAARARTATASLTGPGLLPRSARTSRCGPQLTAPQRIEAQTCVLTEDGLTWGRTYYRNRTGGPLRAALTLLRPDGTTVQVNCEVPAADVPGLCETPTGATVRRGGPYRAVAEFSDAAGERLLLRSGSNSSVGGRGSGR